MLKTEGRRSLRRLGSWAFNEKKNASYNDGCVFSKFRTYLHSSGKILI